MSKNGLSFSYNHYLRYISIKDKIFKHTTLVSTPKIYALTINN